MTSGGSWPLGCQARPWLQTWGRDAFAARLPEAMSQIAGIGFAGFETALNCLPLDDPQRFAEASARANGLVLCGAHAGGRWWDADAVAGIRTLAEQAGRLPALGCRRLVVSIQAVPQSATEEQLDRIVENLSDLGRACREAGDVEVVIHNHAGELADDARGLSAITERCDPGTVALGADLGWVAYAGMDITSFVRRFGSRIAYLHVRDVTAYGPERGFVEVGRGVLDFKALYRALAETGYSGWLVAESEFTDEWRGARDPEETTRAQYQGLRALDDSAGPRW